MLPQKTTATVPYTAPSLTHLIKTYRGKLNNLFDYTYNCQGIDAEVLFEAIVLTMEMVEALSLLKNALDTAVSLLTEREREVVRSHYYKNRSLSKIAEHMNLEEHQIRFLKDEALKKLSRNIECLGFSNERIIEAFNDVELFIDSARQVEELYVEREYDTGKDT